MQRWTLLMLGLTVGCLIGCGRETGEERQQADLARMSEAALADALYLDQLQSEPADGAAAAYDGRDSYVHMELLNLRAYGDLDGDGVEDAAVLLATNTGGSGVFVDLAAVCNHRGQPRDTARFFLGDRVKPERMTVVGQEIELALLIHGPDDPLCCPSERVVWRFRLVGGELVKQ